MNIPIAESQRQKAMQDAPHGGSVYAYGHRDARHAAAEIANEADARIASLEQQLAAAQERERAATLRGDWYEQWVEDTTLEDYREQGESEDDAKRMTERNMQGRRERMREYVAAALAAAQKGTAPASDGEQEGAA